MGPPDGLLEVCLGAGEYKTCYQAQAKVENFHSTLNKTELAGQLWLRPVRGGQLGGGDGGDDVAKLPAARNIRMEVYCTGHPARAFQMPIIRIKG